MLKIAICDDNYTLCSEVERMILEHNTTTCIDIETEVFYSGEKLLKFIENDHKFDLIFLDIELGSTTGILVSNKIRNEFDDHVSKIIFLSSQTGYEKDLFDVQPFNFLTKPIDKEKLIKCIELVTKILDKENKIFEYHSRNYIKKISIKEIIYFESNLKKIKIVTIDNEEYFYGSLEKTKENLPKTFVAPHGSFLVNFNKIERITKKDIHMFGGRVIPISRRNLQNIQDLQIQSTKEVRDANI